MKATGIVRRLDDLGRIVIPKEIRNRYKLREGDPMEIYATNEGIMLVKYQADTKEEFAKKWLAENDHYADSYQSRFTIEGTTVTCEVILGGQRKYGTATCNPHDTFDASVGMAIALCKATGAPIPKELME